MAITLQFRNVRNYKRIFIHCSRIRKKFLLKKRRRYRCENQALETLQKSGGGGFTGGYPRFGKGGGALICFLMCKSAHVAVEAEIVYKVGNLALETG